MLGSLCICIFIATAFIFSVNEGWTVFQYAIRCLLCIKFQSNAKSTIWETMPISIIELKTHQNLYLRAHMWLAPSSCRGLSLRSKFFRQVAFDLSIPWMRPSDPVGPMLLFAKRRVFSFWCFDRNSPTACAPVSINLQCDRSNSSICKIIENITSWPKQMKLATRIKFHDFQSWSREHCTVNCFTIVSLTDR